RKAIPAVLPIQSTPLESASTQFRSDEGRPSLTVKTRHRPFEKALRPFEVANHIVASGLSVIEVTVLDDRPLAVVYVVKRPFLNALSPASKVPAHTVPSLL